MEHLTVETFKEKIFDFEKNEQTLKEGLLPVVIDFYADWCGPCRMIAPILEELSKEYEGKVNIYKINVDEQPVLSSLFAIRSIPAVLFLPTDGQPNMMVGGRPKSAFVDAIKSILKVQ